MERKEKLQSVADAAEFLGAAPSTVYGWAESGLIPCIRWPVGRRKMALRFSRADLEAFVKKNTIPASSAR
jgi:excisionase family DNA binding protein